MTRTTPDPHRVADCCGGPDRPDAQTVGATLRRHRDDAGLTLTDVADLTGISTSTLSRLENGARKASVDLLFPLARLYGKTLDELVAAPPTGDPRIRIRPQSLHGKVALPLSADPRALQSWKLVLPGGRHDVAQRSHAGRGWALVLSGTMLLHLGDEHRTVRAGQTTEFAATIPHDFTSADEHPVEVIMVLARAGERLAPAAS